MTEEANGVTADVAIGTPADEARHQAGRLQRIVRSRSADFGTATGRRFLLVDGFTHAALLSIELFTTVIPLIIIGFAYRHDFSTDANPGDRFIALLGLTGERAEDVRDLFGSAAGIRSTWSVAGLAGFLIWGIPMSITVAAMYARAWQRPAFGIGGKLWRGAVWFVVYLATQSARSRAVAAGYAGPTRLMVVLVAVVVLWLFWSLTPVLLVRDGARGRRSLFAAGFAGVLIDGVVLTVAARIALPILLNGWSGFGPIGVAMTMMTWCGVIGYGWVVTACATAILWERAAPLEMVLETNRRDPLQQERRWTT